MIEAMDGFLQVAGGDSHALPPHIVASDTQRELNEIMAAWAVERGGHVECLLLLDRVRRFLNRSLASETLSDKSCREAAHLLQMIDLLATEVPKDLSADHRRK